MRHEFGDSDGEYESVLLVIKECFVYRIPPRTKSDGFRAAEWDVDQFMWSGRMRIVSKGGRQLFINLEDGATGELFAACHAEDEKAIEPVLDSSRYFVLKLFDKATNQKAFVGVGFEERNVAFDFNVCIQDFHKGVKNEESISSAPAEPVDLSLKEGEKITIAIPRKKAPSGSATQKLQGGILPPPPSSLKPAPSGKSVNNVEVSPEEEDFGDFQTGDGGWQKF